jgi:APA family basic amino acid/polyamine antiporter
MTSLSKKIGFWSVFGIVAGSQIGSGVFMQPASLAPYGGYAMAGWLISGVGAIALALVFSWMCSRFPRTGGPYVYVQEAFGPVAGFFTGWTYWVISWVSTPVLYVAATGYLSPLLGHPTAHALLVIQLSLLCMLTALNLRGVAVAGRVELVLSLMKILPLLIMPVLAVFYFQSDNIMVDQTRVAGLSLSEILSSTALLTLWGFIGVESATTAAGSVSNPRKTIPRAIILGTLCVAILYICNSLGIMGVLPGSVLSESRAPYVDAAQAMFGGNWHLWISIIAAITCIGTANAWTLSSGQSALGLAQDGLLPPIFKRKNKAEAPVCGILASFFGIIPILILTSRESLVAQVNMIIDFSVTAFLFVYLISVAAFFKIYRRQEGSVMSVYFAAGLVAAIFCLWVLWSTSWTTLLLASLFCLTGLPVYFFLYRQNKPALKQA